jgi:predicted permease
MHHWLSELRYAARVLWRNRIVNTVAFVTLTLAIGANTAIFSVVYALLLRPLPYAEPARIVQISRQYPKGPSDSTSVPKYFAWRAGTGDLFTHVAAFENIGSTGFNLVADGRPERVIGSRVSADFFRVLGVPPLAGRGFVESDDAVGGPKVIVLGYGFWQRRFGARVDAAGRPELLGQSIRLNDESYTVIGIMPPAFSFPRNADLWTPLQLQFDPASRDRVNTFDVIGRLKPGVSETQANASLAALAARVRQTDGWMMNDRESIAVRSLQEKLYGPMRSALLVLLSAVGAVLLIACVNVANLQLAQASARQREIAVRAAIGASTWCIVRQLLTESVLLSVISGVAGVALAYAAVPLMLAISPIDALRSGSVASGGVAIDRTVLAFAFALSAAAGVIFGVMPAWQATRTNMDAVLREGARRTTGGGRVAAMRRLLVAGEVALALVLTISGTLLIKSFAGLRAVDPGFSTERVLTMELSLSEAKYGDGARMGQFAEQIESSLRAVPGVQAAAATLTIPLRPGPDMPFRIEGRRSTSGEPVIADALYRPVGSDYFQALQIRLRRGRPFDARDRHGSLPVVIVNEAVARENWPGEDPIGKHLTIGQPILKDIGDPFAREIIGVVSDVRELSLGLKPQPIIYIPIGQQNDGMTRLLTRLFPITLVVRTKAEEPASMTAATQAAIWRVDPEQTVANVRVMDAVVTRSLGANRFNAVLLGMLAGLALLLAAVGLYGVLSHLVGQQRREIGVRMALGATEGGVLRLFLSQGLTLVSMGTIAGLAAAYGATRFLGSMLVGVSTTDPSTFVVAPIVLLLVALVAVAVPAWRAARVDPASALRAD